MATFATFIKARRWLRAARLNGYVNWYVKRDNILIGLDKIRESARSVSENTVTSSLYLSGKKDMQVINNVVPY